MADSTSELITDRVASSTQKGEASNAAPQEVRANSITEGIARDLQRINNEVATSPLVERQESPARKDEKRNEKELAQERKPAIEQNVKPEEKPTKEIEATRAAPQVQSDSKEWTLDERNESRKHLQKRLDDNFIGHGKEYYFRDNERVVAFTDEKKALTTKHHTNDVVVAGMVDAAQSKGWKHINVDGSEPFKQKVWLEAVQRGLVVQGYDPTPIDLQRLERERQVNQISRGSERGINPESELVTPLNVRTQETSNREQSQALTADQRFDRVVNFGEAPYRNDPQENRSFYVTLENETGKQRQVWGKDLERALDEQRVKPGDYINVSQTGKKEVEVLANVRDDKGNVVAQEKQSVHRNEWQVARRDPLPIEREVDLTSNPQRQAVNASISTDRAANKDQDQKAVQNIEQRSYEMDVDRRNGVSSQAAKVIAHQDVVDLSDIRSPALRERAVESIEHAAAGQQRFANAVSREASSTPVHVHVEAPKREDKDQASPQVRETFKAIMARDNVSPELQERVLMTVDSTYREMRQEGYQPTVQMYDIKANREPLRVSREIEPVRIMRDVEPAIERPSIPR